MTTGAVPHPGAAAATGEVKSFDRHLLLPYLGTSPSFGSWETLFPTGSPEVFSRTCREPHSVWKEMYPVLPFPHLP